MRRHRAYGVVLESSVDLPELPRADEGEGEPAIRVVFVDEPLPPPAPFHVWTLPSGERWLECARLGTDYHLRFPGLADFVVARASREVRVRALAPLLTVRHLLLDQVLPLVFNALGRDALHATAVLTPRGAVAFAGETGAGKSTLAASFAELGCPTISDDCLLLDVSEEDGIRVVPAYPGVRLYEDSRRGVGDLHATGRVADYSTKQRVVSRGDFPRAPVPLRVIYHLAQSGEDAPSSGPVPPSEAFVALTTSSFRLDVDDGPMLVRQMELFSRVVAAVPVRRLSVPRSFARLADARALVLRELGP